MDVDMDHASGWGLFHIFPLEVVLTVVNKLPLLDALHLCQTSTPLRRVATMPTSNLKSRLMKLAFHYIDTKKPMLAIATLETALALFPTHADIYKELGCSWMDVSKPQRAVKIFRQGVDVAAGTAYAHILRAQTEWALGNNEAAWKCSDDAVKADPRDPRTYHFRAFMQSSLASGPEDKKSQKLEIDDYHYILHHLTNYHRISIIHNNLGYVYYEMKKYDKANKHFDISMDLCPHHVQTYYNKAVCLADQGNLAAATHYCDKMIALNPTHSDAHALRGWIYIGQGQIAAGVDSYRKALDTQLTLDAYTIIVYTGSLVSLGRFEEVEATLSEYIPIFTRKCNRVLQRRASESDKEVLDYLNNKLKAHESGLAVCLRVKAEIEALHGRFDHLMELHTQYQQSLSYLPTTASAKYASPMLKFLSRLDLRAVRSQVVDYVLEYHRYRKEGRDIDDAFRSLQNHLAAHPIELNVNEQKYLVACVAHFLLSLFWEADPFQEMLEDFWTLWDREDPGFVILARRPHFLVNMFELTTRLGNGDALQMIFRAAVGNTIDDRLLIQALGQLGNMRQLHQDGNDVDFEEDEDLPDDVDDEDSDADYISVSSGD